MKGADLLAMPHVSCKMQAIHIHAYLNRESSMITGWDEYYMSDSTKSVRAHFGSCLRFPCQ